MLAQIAVMSDLVGRGFPTTTALTTLLTMEGLLFAALGLAATFSSVGGRRLRKLPVSVEVLGAAAISVLTMVAIGALTAWSKIFLRTFPYEWHDIVIAFTLLVAILAQPLIAVLLGLGLRTRR